MSISGTASKDAGEWGNNKEMNPAANTSVMDDDTDPVGDQEQAEGWREDNSTDDPGRTPGKAEGVDDPEATGNEDR